MKAKLLQYYNLYKSTPQAIGTGKLHLDRIAIVVLTVYEKCSPNKDRKTTNVYTEFLFHNNNQLIFNQFLISKLHI